MKVLTKLFISLLFLATIVGAYFLGIKVTKNQYQKQINSLNLKLTPTRFVAPDYYGKINENGWLSYNNKLLGLSFEYPPDYIITNLKSFIKGTGDCSLTIEKYFDGMFHTSSGDRIFFVVVPKDNKIKCGGNYQPYTEKKYQFLNGLKVGEKKSLEENSSISDYFLYARLPDKNLSGLKMKAFYSNKVWETFSGTKEYVYIYESKNTIYYLGGLIDSDVTNGQTIPEAVFQQILSSLKIDLKE